jgi:CRP-like cAMP-binding protein
MIVAYDPMALTEVIKAQEYIDSARSRPASKTHVEIWQELYESLTEEETEALESELQKVTFQPGQTIFGQGKKNANLYFIEAGHAKHIFHQGNREGFIKKIATGNIANEESFFDAGLCTSSLIAVEQVSAHFLPSMTLLTWEGHLPGLESKLRDFSARETKIPDLLKKSSQDRRVQRRVSLPGRILLKVVNVAGEVVGKTLRGDLGDVSVGGVSFFVKTSNREQAQMLLGHNLHLRFNLPPMMTEIELLGQVLGVKRQTQAFATKEDYSVHVRFLKLLPEKSISEAERFIKMLKVTKSNS